MYEWIFHFTSEDVYDGAFKDKYVGEIIEFPITFFIETVTPSNTTDVSCQLVDAENYNIVGKLTHQNPLILDCGIKMEVHFQENNQFALDTMLKAQGTLSLNSDYCQSNGLPPMVYTWQIKRIQIQTAPLIEIDAPIGYDFIRDPEKLGYVDLERTNVYEDDEGWGEYLLTCVKLDVPPLDADEWGEHLDKIWHLPYKLEG